MTPELQHHMSQPYRIQVTPDRGTYGEQLYFATVVELPGCESHGATPEEAIRNVRDAMALYLESMLEDGIIPPLPESRGADGWSVGPQGQRSHIPSGGTA